MNAHTRGDLGTARGVEARRDAAFDLAEHAVRTDYEDLPPNMVEVTKKNILDVIAVSIAGSSVGVGCREIVELVKEGGGKPESTILGYGGKVPAWMAAFANGSMAHALDYDDTLDDGATHIGAGTIPAALAVSERVGKVSGKRFIAAVATGMEIGARIAMAAQPNGIIVGKWVMPMIGGYFSGTAAAGSILGLSSEQMVNAFGLAYSQCSGSFEVVWGEGSMRGIYPSYPGKSSVLAALMAQKGVTGPKDTLEGKAGLLPLYYGGVFDASVLTESLGSRWRGADISFKPWPCCRWSHTAVEVTLGMLSEHGFRAEDVEQVVVWTNEVSQPLFEPLHVRQNPGHLSEAQFSMPYILAAAIARRCVDIKTFTSEVRDDPRVRALARKVISRPGDARIVGKEFAIKVEITTRQGVFSREESRAYGHPEKPISMDDLVKKADDCFSHAVKPIPRDRARQVIERLANLEQEEDVGEIIGLVA